MALDFMTTPDNAGASSIPSTVMTIDQDGAVGIGVDTPERTLHIRANNTQIRIDRDANSPTMGLYRFPSGNFTTPWKGFLIGAYAAGADDGYFFISDHHQNTSGSSDRRLTIDTDGNVGIGTETPNELLEIAGNVLIRNSQQNPALIVSTGTGGVGVDPELYIQSAESGTGTNAEFHISRNAYFQTSDDTYNRTDVGEASSCIRFDADGNVILGHVSADANPITWKDVYVRKTTINSLVIGDAKPANLGSDNMIIGFNSGGTNSTSANNNIVMGIDVAPSLPTATSDNNILIGRNIFSGLSLGTDRNVVVGNNLPMSSVQNASHNIVIGEDLLTDVSTLTNAIVMGRNSVKSVTNIERTVAIGTNIDNATTALTDSIVIGEGLDLPASVDYYMNLGGVIHADLEYGYVSIGTTVAKPSGTNAGDLFTEGRINDYWMGNVGNNLVISEDDLSNFTVDTTSNIIIGHGTTAESLIEGTDNIVIGANTFDVLTVGYSNIIIGSNTAVTGTLEDNNIIIGEAENQPSGTNSYALNIGGLITGDISTDRVRIGGTATDALLASACLELKSTTGALIVPRMTTTQRNNMTAVNGMIIYDTTQNAFRFYENGAWTSK